MEVDTLPRAPELTAQRLRNLADLPGPRGLPVLGNLLQIDRQRVHQTVEQWSREYGPIFRFQFASRRFMAVSDHALLQQVLRDRPDGFRRTAKLQATWEELGLPSGVFGAEGEAWHRQRRMVMAGFDPGHVRAYFPSLLTVAQRLGRRWQVAARSGTPIDLQADLMRFTVDAITGLAFGADLNTLESDEVVIQRHLDKIFPAIFRRVLAQVRYWRYIKLPGDRELERSVAAVKAAIDGFVQQARERMRADPALRTHPNNLLEAMIAAADTEGSGLKDVDVAGNVLTMLLAGEDTTAHTLAWMIHLLHANPDALARATAEVRRVAPDSAAFTAEQVHGLDFVEACAHETMRLKPVAPFFAVEALRDSVVGDVRVPKGTLVWAVFRADSVADKYFPNAAAFEPARWLTEDKAGASSSAKRVSMPFGAGPRVCPGRYLALLEMKMVMATLLGQFDIDHVGTVDGEPVREQLSFTMAPMGLRMRLRERQAGPG
jgi:cytochrome P450